MVITNNESERFDESDRIYAARELAKLGDASTAVEALSCPG